MMTRDIVKRKIRISLAMEFKSACVIFINTAFLTTSMADENNK